MEINAPLTGLVSLNKVLIQYNTNTIVAGGVAVCVIFPNPITIGVLGGAATLIAGNNGIFGKTKKIKEKSKERKRNKEEVKNMALEQTCREVAKDVQSIIYRLDNQVEPSAPELYPDLKKA